MFKAYLSLIAAVLLLTACGTANDSTGYSSQLRGAVISPARELSDFSVMSTTGAEFTLSEHQGEVILLYFGYRACPDFCPTTFAELNRLYSQLNQPADKLKIVFVTLDPERDTLELLSLYTAAFNPDFIGLRPEGESLSTLQAEFGVVSARRSIGDAPQAYLLDHTASLFLIGPTGRLEVQYLYGTDFDDISHDVRLILESL